MTTLEIIKLDGQAALDKLSRGESISASDKELIKIYNSLYSGTAGNAGKRKVIRTGK